jgi:DNA helicase II / ATP-dependent DNA helicase PcrA
MNFSEFQQKFHIALDPQQMTAVQAAEGATLLLAVPGSGKTTVLVTRLAYLIYVKGVQPESILTMTYTVAAAQDMRARFAALFQSDLAEQLEFRTINGVSSRIIRYYEISKKRTAFSLLQDSGRQISLLRAICQKQTNQYISESTIKAVQTQITYAKNAMLTEEQLEELDVDGVDFPAAYRSYNQYLRQHKLMDYDDQMVYAYQILCRYPEILDAFQNRYRYICVDEAQDTSKIQHAIIHLIASQYRNLFMVGDEDQSIYGFRAACPQELFTFEDRYPEGRVLLMEQNYRSTEEIVHAANRFIHLNQNRRPKQLHATQGNGKPVKQIVLNRRTDQYKYLLKVAKSCDTETAVLYRDNESALPLIDLLERNGVPYRTKKIERLFFTHWIVRDIIDIIRFAIASDDGEIFRRIYYKFNAGISRIAMEQAVKQSAEEGKPILECLVEVEDGSAWMKKQCKSLQAHMDELLSERGDRAIRHIVQMGYGDYLDSSHADTSKIDVLAAIGANEDSPIGLLRRLSELEQLIGQDHADDDSKFILSTIHSSKGLEFECVYLIDVADGLLPKVAPANNPAATPEGLDAYEEERRLFYVGMTRAKRELNVFCFRSPQLFSSFTSFLFPQRTAEQQKKVAKKSTLPQYQQGMTKQKIKESGRQFCTGAIVQHNAFGRGKIADVSNGIIKVQFEDGSIRSLQLSTALQAGCIKIIAN